MDNGTTPSANDIIFGCELFPDRADFCDTLLYCKWISTAVSIVGSVFTIAVIWLFRKYKEFAQRMILHVCGAALLLSVAFSLSGVEPSPGPRCSVQAAGMTFAAWAVMLWVLAIVGNLYCIVVRRQSMEKYERLCVVLCWLLPLVMAGLPVAGDAYQPAGAWCWIRNSPGWRYGVWYSWNMLSVLIVFVVIAYILCYLRRATNERDGSMDPISVARFKSLRKDARTLRFYPVVYFVLRLFNTINRIQNSVAGVNKQEEYSFPLLLMQTIMVPLFGAAIAVVFVLDRRTFSMLTPSRVKAALVKRFRRTHINEMTFPGTDVSGDTTTTTADNNANSSTTTTIIDVENVAAMAINANCYKTKALNVNSGTTTAINVDNVAKTATDANNVTSTAINVDNIAPETKDANSRTTTAIDVENFAITAIDVNSGTTTAIDVDNIVTTTLDPNSCKTTATDIDNIHGTDIVSKSCDTTEIGVDNVIAARTMNADSDITTSIEIDNVTTATIDAESITTAMGMDSVATPNVDGNSFTNTAIDVENHTAAATLQQR